MPRAAIVVCLPRSELRAVRKHLTEAGVEISDLFRLVRRDVEAATKGEQIPWETSSLSGDFYFVPKQP